ncbi:MAG TPA: glycosyltransferase family 39 protein, partial [Anaerolineales bacterium]|nr:glycosyltransferase family 39 protein [Anaerolineales bacterium]
MEGLSALRAIDRINRQRHVLWVALALVAALSLFSSATNPLFEPPDELQHYQFVRYLVEERKLPVAELNKEASQTRRLFDSTPSGLNRPPLYYIIGALLVAQIDDPEEIPAGNPFWAYMPEQVSRDNKQQFLNTDSQTFPYNGTALTVHLLRLWSSALALCTVTVMWLLGRTLWPDGLARMAAMLSIAVLNPMFLYLAGAITNDNLIILCGTLSLWLSVRALKDGFTYRTTILIGVVWGCALLSKLTGLMLAIPWGVALVYTAEQRQDRKLFISRIAVVIGIALALSGWWFIRHLLLYGELFTLSVMGDWVSRRQLGTTWIWHDL